jgi:hypothetical protein
MMKQQGVLCSSQVRRKIMQASELPHAKNPDLIASLTAIKRAASMARQAAIATNTGIVIVKDGKLCRISATELKTQDAQ